MWRHAFELSQLAAVRAIRGNPPVAATQTTKHITKPADDFIAAEQPVLQLGHSYVETALHTERWIVEVAGKFKFVACNQCM